MRRPRGRSGSVFIVLIFGICFVWTLLAALLASVALQYREAARLRMSAQALHVAEGAARKALWELSRGRADYAGETLALDVGVARVEARVEGARAVITATGLVPNGRRAAATRIVQVEAVKDARGTFRIASWQSW